MAIATDIVRSGHRGARDAGSGTRVLVLGLRGILNVQGGIETHARKLYPLIARLGCEVEIVQRSPYYDPADRPASWHGVHLTYLWSPKRQALETGIHTLLGVLYAAIRRPDVLHLHAIGPGLMAPLARLLGLNVVLTCHAPDYERDKFSALEKGLLRLGEILGVRFANRSIAVSRALKSDLQQRFGHRVVCIPNGAPRSVPAVSAHALDRFGLSKGRYVLCVGRLDPVKRHADLIEAFELADASDWKLVFVGGIDRDDSYSHLILEHADENPSIVLTDYQKGLALRELYTHAGLFVLASSTEGHPIALLEAMSYRLPVAASAIPANLALPIPRDRFFGVGDIRGIAALIRRSVETPDCATLESSRDEVLAEFSWRRAAHLTRHVYRHLAPGGHRPPGGQGPRHGSKTESWQRQS